MRLTIIALVAVMLCLSMAAAWSYPTWDGGAGIVTMPTAEVAPTGAVDLALDYQKSGDFTMWPLRAGFGIATNAEVWAGYNRLNDSSVDATGKIWNFGGKYLLMTEPKDKISLAVGAGWGKYDLEDSVDATKAFIVATKNFRMKQAASLKVASKASVGLLYQKLSDPVDESITKPFVGIEFSNAAGTTLGLEYRFKDESIDSDPVFSAVLRCPVGKSVNPLWVEIGTTNGGLSMGSNEHKVFFGVGYRFGVSKSGSGSNGDVHSGPWGY